MPADPSIYGLVGQGVRSVADYDNIANTQKINALALLLHQQQYAQGQQGIADDNALRAATQQFGTDAAANRNLIAGTGNFKALSAFDKAQQDAAESKSKTELQGAQALEAKSKGRGYDLDQTIKNHDFSIQKLGGLTDPSQVNGWIADNVKNGVFTFQQASEAANRFQQASTQPGFDFNGWKQSAILGGVSATDQYKQAQELIRSREANETSRANNADTNKTHITTTGMTNAVTMRGQNMVNARALDAQGGIDYKQDADGNWIGLPKKPAAGQPITATPVVGADGKPLTSAGKPLTETQGKATTFAARMQDAEGTIKTLESQGISGADLRTIAAGNSFTNFLASPQGQQYRQAQENWVTANLRQESGAAIGKDEMAKDVAKFFPKPGDAPGVIAQKRQAREVAARGMLVQAGPGAKQVSTIVGAPSTSTGLPGSDAIAAELARRGH